MFLMFSIALLVGGFQVGQGQAAIEGRVTDRDGGVMPGVTVAVSSSALQTPATLTTDDRGAFRLAELAAGTYEFTISHPSFRTARGRVSVRAGQRSAVSFQMDLGAREEIVNVRLADGVGPPVTAQPTGGPIRVGGAIQEPRKVHHVSPLYPAAAAAAAADGVVIIEAIIGRDGRVERARVVQGVPLLNTAALDAVRQWQYTPTMLNGVPVEVSMIVSIAFARYRPTGSRSAAGRGKQPPAVPRASGAQSRLANGARLVRPESADESRERDSRGSGGKAPRSANESSDPEPCARLRPRTLSRQRGRSARGTPDP